MKYLTSQFLEALATVHQQRLHYTVEFHHREAVEAAYATERWMIPMIHQINQAMPAPEYKPVDGKPNGNNGRKNHVFKIGREYTEVLYVTLVRTVGFEHMTADDWQALKDKMIVIGGRFLADEIELVEDDETTLTFRFWWD